ncbi:unnamed protein product [Amoebophrya sp. A120]|nr:unnamed protein product [Amoebophrya sp. A120]|eukprot:GSA120T00000348001.1
MRPPFSLQRRGGFLRSPIDSGKINAAVIEDRRFLRAHHHQGEHSSSRRLASCGRRGLVLVLFYLFAINMLSLLGSIFTLGVFHLFLARALELGGSVDTGIFTTITAPTFPGFFVAAELMELRRKEGQETENDSSEADGITSSIQNTDDTRSLSPRILETDQVVQSTALQRRAYYGLEFAQEFGLDPDVAAALDRGVREREQRLAEEAAQRAAQKKADRLAQQEADRKQAAEEAENYRLRVKNEEPPTLTDDDEEMNDVSVENEKDDKVERGVTHFLLAPDTTEVFPKMDNKCPAPGGEKEKRIQAWFPRRIFDTVGQLWHKAKGKLRVPDLKKPFRFLLDKAMWLKDKLMDAGSNAVKWITKMTLGEARFTRMFGVLTDRLAQTTSLTLGVAAQATLFRFVPGVAVPIGDYLHGTVKKMVERFMNKGPLQFLRKLLVDVVGRRLVVSIVPYVVRLALEQLWKLVTAAFPKVVALLENLGKFAWWGVTAVGGRVKAALGHLARKLAELGHGVLKKAKKLAGALLNKLFGEKKAAPQKDHVDEPAADVEQRVPSSSGVLAHGEGGGDPQEQEVRDPSVPDDKENEDKITEKVDDEMNDKGLKKTLDDVKADTKVDAAETQVKEGWEAVGGEVQTLALTANEQMAESVKTETSNPENQSREGFFKRVTRRVRDLFGSISLETVMNKMWSAGAGMVEWLSANIARLFSSVLYNAMLFKLAAIVSDLVLGVLHLFKLPAWLTGKLANQLVQAVVLVLGIQFEGKITELLEHVLKDHLPSLVKKFVEFMKAGAEKLRTSLRTMLPERALEALNSLKTSVWSKITALFGRARSSAGTAVQVVRTAVATVARTATFTRNNGGGPGGDAATSGGGTGSASAVAEDGGVAFLQKHQAAGSGVPNLDPDEDAELRGEISAGENVEDFYEKADKRAQDIESNEVLRLAPPTADDDGDEEAAPPARSGGHRLSWLRTGLGRVAQFVTPWRDNAHRGAELAVQKFGVATERVRRFIRSSSSSFVEYVKNLGARNLGASVRTVTEVVLSAVVDYVFPYIFGVLSKIAPILIPFEFILRLLMHQLVSQLWKFELPATPESRSLLEINERAAGVDDEPGSAQGADPATQLGDKIYEHFLDEANGYIQSVIRGTLKKKILMRIKETFGFPGEAHDVDAGSSDEGPRPTDAEAGQQTPTAPARGEEEEDVVPGVVGSSSFLETTADGTQLPATPDIATPQIAPAENKGFLARRPSSSEPGRPAETGLEGTIAGGDTSAGEEEQHGGTGNPARVRMRTAAAKQNRKFLSRRADVVVDDAQTDFDASTTVVEQLLGQSDDFQAWAGSLMEQGSGGDDSAESDDEDEERQGTGSSRAVEAEQHDLLEQGSLVEVSREVSRLDENEEKDKWEDLLKAKEQEEAIGKIETELFFPKPHTPREEQHQDEGGQPGAAAAGAGGSPASGSSGLRARRYVQPSAAAAGAGASPASSSSSASGGEKTPLKRFLHSMGENLKQAVTKLLDVPDTELVEDGEDGAPVPGKAREGGHARSGQDDEDARRGGQGQVMKGETTLLETVVEKVPFFKNIFHFITRSFYNSMMSMLTSAVARLQLITFLRFYTPRTPVGASIPIAIRTLTYAVFTQGKVAAKMREYTDRALFKSWALVKQVASSVFQKLIAVVQHFATNSVKKFQELWGKAKKLLFPPAAQPEIPAAQQDEPRPEPHDEPRPEPQDEPRPEP